jgi:DNA-binding MarR family transcriptional regulator
VTLDEAIERVQFAYPQIYYACHSRHGRRRSNPVRLSTSDAELLVHIDRQEGALVSSLARHLSLSRSTISAALTRLASFGYVVKEKAPGEDRRQVRMRLTASGVSAVRATSVLEARKLRAVLARLSAADRSVVVDGLGRLAQSCRANPVSKSRVRATE